MTTDEIIAAIDAQHLSDEDRFLIARAAVTRPYDLTHAGKGRTPIFHSGDGPLNDKFRGVSNCALRGLAQVEHNEQKRTLNG